MIKDVNGEELVEGDLVMLVIDNPVERTTDIVRFIAMEEFTYKITSDDEELTKTTCKLKYYPLTEEGLEVATFDKGITTNDFHRQDEFIVTNIKSKNLIKWEEEKLNSFQTDINNKIKNL
jgi:hypothetical protein